MHDDTTNKTELSILDRAIKARARRDRDGKKRRPVTDGLIEHAEELRKERDEASERASRYFSEIKLSVEKTEELEEIIASRDAEIAALNARLDEIRGNAIGLASMVNEQTEA